MLFNQYPYNLNNCTESKQKNNKKFKNYKFID